MKEIEINKLLREDLELPLVTIISPNYEERSIHCFKEIININKYAKIYPIILYLKNRNNNNALLDGLKHQNYKKLSEDIDINDKCDIIDFPDNYSANAIEYILKKRLKEYSKNSQSINVLLDITSMPRRLIFTLCDIIGKFIKENKFEINKLLFSYVSPQNHSKVQYAQDVGMLYSFFSDQPLKISAHKSVCSMIFPSRSGHEGKLLLDYLDSKSIDHRRKIFFSINSSNYLDSLEIMRANQALLNSHESEIKYYCSFIDGVRKLTTQINKEVVKLQKNPQTEGQLYLVAPFSPKIILPVAYYALKKLERFTHELGTEIDICDTRSFQYTSVYSLGIGKLSIYELNVREFI